MSLYSLFSYLYTALPKNIKTGVGKLRPMGQIQPSKIKYLVRLEVLFIPKHTCLKYTNSFSSKNLQLDS